MLGVGRPPRPTFSSSRVVDQRRQAMRLYNLARWSAIDGAHRHAGPMGFLDQVGETGAEAEVELGHAGTLVAEGGHGNLPPLVEWS